MVFRKPVCIFIGICLLFFVFLSLLFLGFWLFFKHNKACNKGIVQTENHVKYYQYFEKDHLKNETSFGIVSLSHDEDFLSYSDFSLRKQILISSFGTDEYECYGSCFCENEENRRTSSSIVFIKGVSYLLAALSSFAAINLAKDFYSEKCKEKYSHICEAESISSEVEECNKVIEEDYVKKEDDVEKRVYFCYGNCVDSAHAIKNIRPTSSEKIFCQKLKRQGEIEVFSNDLVRKSKNMHLSMKMRDTARLRFLSRELKDFCKENSRIEYYYTHRTQGTLKSGEKKIYEHERRKTGNLCSSSSQAKSTEYLKNVNCRQVKPVPSTINNLYWDKVWSDKKKEWDKI